eukprot:TRINITY_DN308_c0_g1_i4.p1 TRINITY_DN308_c0_g1~~TRINITY_DN308_c0_g1_i4.p1  ORF type:complete len:341 (+),score=24.63 TRINITY_DN308_c0_g1_i4:355-1377(+)
MISKTSMDTSLRRLWILYFMIFTYAAALEAGSLPGWMGETYSGRTETRSMPYERRNLIRSTGKAVMRGGDTAMMNPGAHVIQLSMKPRAFLYKRLLSASECDHLIAVASGQLAKSMVTDNESGKPVDSTIRTSHGMFITAKDDVVRGIEERIAKWTFSPIENGEAIQVLRYNLGQKYDAHYDYFHDDKNKQLGGNRYATVLMYLSDVESGGETVFPNAQAAAHQADGTWSDCGIKGLGVKPSKGDALLFFSMKPNSTPDEFSMHTACPVLKGVKWSATKWIHEDSFEVVPQRDSTKCEDYDPRCSEWAAAGECSRNALYMVGDEHALGSCRKACKVCIGR